MQMTFDSPFKPNTLKDNFDNHVQFTDDQVLEPENAPDGKINDTKQTDKETPETFNDYYYNTHDKNLSEHKNK